MEGRRAQRERGGARSGAEAECHRKRQKGEEGGGGGSGWRADTRGGGGGHDLLEENLAVCAVLSSRYRVAHVLVGSFACDIHGGGEAGGEAEGVGGEAEGVGGAPRAVSIERHLFIRPIPLEKSIEMGVRTTA